MNALRERLGRLADAGTEGIELARPDRRAPAVAPGGRPWWRSGPVMAAAALVVVAAGTAAVALARGGDGDDDVAVSDQNDDRDGDGSAADAGAAGAVVAVTFGDASMVGDPVDLTLRFLDADGELIAERSWSEVEQAAGGGGVVVDGGLVQPLPAGELALEATLGGSGEPVSCTQPFTTAAGDRLILRLALGTGATCAEVEPVADWVDGRTTPTGVEYIGLSETEAEDKAGAAGLTTRVVATDGMDLAVTMDFRPDRLDLVLFDGSVVAASLPGEEAVPAELECPLGDNSCTTIAFPPLPPGQGTLAVDLEPVEGTLTEGFDVTLRFYDADGNLLAEREWSDSVGAAGPDTADVGSDRYYTHVLSQRVPAGSVRLVTFMRTSPGGAIAPPEGPGCETTVDVAEGDRARVTLLFGEDQTGACASVAAANAAADELLGMPRGLPAPGFVGLSEDEAVDEAAARGWSVRVLARDGEGGPRTEDYQPERVNLVIEDGMVVAAART